LNLETAVKEHIEREALPEEVSADGMSDSAVAFATGYNTCLKDVKRIPTADVRPVVRCKDCRHRDPEDHKCDCGQLERAGCVFSVDDDYFCAYGER